MKHSKTGSGDSFKIVRGRGKTSASKSSPHSSLAGFQGLLKRTIDIVLSTLALVLLSPLLLLIAFMIRFVDGGSVLYKQIRVGLGRRTFTIVKFRTMHEEAEQELGAIWSVPNDPRCTLIGTYLRRLGLDELPQLWNVIRGEMSLVGPRPERPEFTREFRKEHRGYDIRHSVRPGLTGYAQVHGWRGYTSLEERLRHDLYYIRHWSVALDLYILLLTALRGWSEKTRNGLANQL